MRLWVRGATTKTSVPHETTRASPSALACAAASTGPSDAAPAAIDAISERTRLEERLMLGLRLADGVALDEVAPVLDQAGLDRLIGLELASIEGGRIRLAQRGRMLLHDCVAELLNDEPA